MKEGLRKIIREALLEIKEGPMQLKSSDKIISEGLKYHLDNKISLSNTIFRYSSEKHIELINEVRSLYENGLIDLSEDDKFIISTDAGMKGMYDNQEVLLDMPFIVYNEISESNTYNGKKVNLNKPFRTPGGPKKFAVYVKDDDGIIRKVTFGDPNLRVRNYNIKAAKSFRARHRCHEKKDKTKPGYWSCNVGRYAELLGLSSKNPW